jgi:hypothetical protein
MGAAGCWERRSSRSSPATPTFPARTGCTASHPPVSTCRRDTSRSRWSSQQLECFQMYPQHCLSKDNRKVGATTKQGRKIGHPPPLLHPSSTPPQPISHNSSRTVGFTMSWTGTPHTNKTTRAARWGSTTLRPTPHPTCHPKLHPTPRPTTTPRDTTRHHAPRQARHDVSTRRPLARRAHRCAEGGRGGCGHTHPAHTQTPRIRHLTRRVAGVHVHDVARRQRHTGAA